MKPTILVTGGAGYIGSHTVRLLRRCGYPVVVVDHLHQGHRSSLPSDVPLILSPIGHIDTMVDTFQTYHVQAVLHFAAWIEVGRGEKEPFAFYDNNVGQTLLLLQAMQSAGISRILFSSTAAVFGETSEQPLTESATKAPASVYGRTKYFVENILQDIAATGKISYGILRYFNAAGADEAGDIGEAHHPETHLIPLILQVALQQRSHISVYGTDYPTRDGTCIRDYIHVNDLAHAHLLSLERLLSDRGNFAYNLGSGEGSSVREVIDTCRTITHCDIPVIESPRRPGDVPLLLADSRKIQNELGWTPRYSLQQIVSTAWRWHKTHPHGYNNNTASSVSPVR